MPVALSRCDLSFWLEQKKAEGRSLSVVMGSSYGVVLLGFFVCLFDCINTDLRLLILVVCLLLSLHTCPGD